MTPQGFLSLEKDSKRLVPQGYLKQDFHIYTERMTKVLMILFATKMYKQHLHAIHNMNVVPSGHNTTHIAYAFGTKIKVVIIRTELRTDTEVQHAETTQPDQCRESSTPRAWLHRARKPDRR
jgi:hypothetical protein